MSQDFLLFWVVFRASAQGCHLHAQLEKESKVAGPSFLPKVIIWNIVWKRPVAGECHEPRMNIGSGFVTVLRSPSAT